MENFPNQEKEVNTQIMEVQRTPKKMYPRKTTPRHTIKMTKVKYKERELKVAREKRLLIMETPSGYQQNSYFTGQKECNEIFNVLKQKYLQTRIPYPARLSFKLGEIKHFLGK